MINKMLNFAMFGAGRIGQVHAKALNLVDGAQLVAVADLSEDAAASVTQITGAKHSSVEVILSDSTIDAVIIASPTHLHAQQIEQVAKAGKHIFCEKPIDLELDKVTEVAEIVEDSKVFFMLGFNRRFDVHFLQLKHQLDAGVIGNIESIHITSRDPQPPSIEYAKTSGGLFRDMTIHDFDMARYLLGEEFSDIQASGATLIDPEFEQLEDIDTAVVVLKSVSGKLVSISNSRRACYGYDQRIEVHGSAGLLIADNPTHTTLMSANQSGYRTEPLMDFFLDRYRLAYQHELQSFVSGLNGAELQLPNCTDGVRALELAEAALESLKTQQTVHL